MNKFIKDILVHPTRLIVIRLHNTARTITHRHITHRHTVIHRIMDDMNMIKMQSIERSSRIIIRIITMDTNTRTSN